MLGKNLERKIITYQEFLVLCQMFYAYSYLILITIRYDILFNLAVDV